MAKFTKQWKKRDIIATAEKIAAAQEKESRRLTRLHDNLLNAIKASIAVSIRPSNEQAQCFFALFSNLVNNLRAKVLPEIHPSTSCLLMEPLALLKPTRNVTAPSTTLLPLVKKGWPHIQNNPSQWTH